MQWNSETCGFKLNYIFCLKQIIFQGFQSQSYATFPIEIKL